ncbi:MAG: DegT/DnrJ/EryC1/StrS family aminotransferase [Thermodesulfovibrionales bacterium]|jgi:perosamine synthetase
MKRIPVACPFFNGNEKKYVLDCIETGWVSSIGKYIEKFEEKFARFCGVKHAISCSNGTAALHLALLACDVGSGDEVIVPTLTYIAAANAVTYCEARPVFVDSEADTWNIDPSKIEEKITPKTKGILVIHLYGHPADMDPILDIAKKHNLFVIEDAAEAHGARHRNRTVGSLGDIGTFSFFGNKIITTGEGGMVVTDDPVRAERIRRLKGQGVDPKRRYWFPIVGYNYRMTNIQAAIGLAQLENISWHLQRRRELADLYHNHLSGLSDFLDLPVEKQWARHAYWMFSVILRDPVCMSRDRFTDALQKEGIETRPLFYPMHVLPPYRDSDSEDTFPVATHLASRGLNLPTHASLTEDDIVYITGRIRKICQSAA